MFARPVLIVLLACCLPSFPLSHLNAQQAAPETPAGQRLKQLIEFVNGEGDPDFAKTGFLDQAEDRIAHREAQTEQVRSEFGEFEVQKTESTSPHQISALCKTSQGPSILLTIQVASEAPHAISRIELEVGGELGGRAEEPQGPLTADERAEAIDRLAQELESKYVFPEVAEKMVASLNAALEKGEYQEVKDAGEFAIRLTNQLQDICHDKHLRIRVRSAARNRARQSRRQVSNHGFVKAEMLEGGIGYLKFNFFDGNPEAEKTAAAAMNFLANSKAIIFDLRENGGGSPQMIAFLSGYLFDESVHLNSFYNRPTDTTTESWSRDDVPGQRLGEDVPVYVLTSNYTFSGAEEFSYNLKHLKRGILVGETTGGGAHPVRPVTLGARLEASLPFARAINPVTKTNWEGTGVQPHVRVSSDLALDKALELARTSLKSPTESSSATATDQDTAGLMEQGQELMRAQEFEQAAAKFQQVVDHKPDNGMAWYQLGYSLHAAGQLDDAIAAHRKAMKFKQFEVVATYNLACAYALQDKTDEAIDALKRAVEKGFSDADHLAADTDLDSIRNDDRFKQIAADLGGNAAC